MKLTNYLTLSLLGLSLLGCNKNEESDAFKIAVIPKGTTHVFWKSVHSGAKAAEAELDARGEPVDIIWKGPLREDDRAEQVGVVETFVGQGVDGIILAPLDKKALVAPVALARQAGIPTIVFDSALDSQDVVSFVATDNFKGGELAGHALAKSIGQKGKVLMLRYQIGSASTEDREAGFLAAIGQYPEITVVSKNQYAGATRDTAYTAAQNLLNRLGEDLVGIFTPNESSTNGMLLALREAGKTDSVKLVGFDGGEQNVEAMDNGEISALVIQDPFKMGYESVMTMAAHLSAQPVQDSVDTGVTLVTRQTTKDPSIKRLLNPDLSNLD